MSHRFFGVTIAILGATGVAFGAFGAHALRNQLTASGHLDNWRTAVSYQLIHTVAALAIWALLQVENQSLRPKPLRAALACWLAGVVVFSGSIFALCLGSPRWLGPVTPLGGLALIAGWLCLLVAALKNKA